MTAALAAALRAEAKKVDSVRSTLRDIDNTLYRDLDQSAELIRCLARMVAGKPISEAFGAPGDFGHDTALGAALANHYSSPTRETGLS